jgi:aminoglycoside 3-N-acetyltransferase
MTQEADFIERIADDLLVIGVHPGGVLLVHSSLSALGHVSGGAETVIRGLLRALGDEGTLLMPALSYERVTFQHPVFDVRHTPSNVGTISEHFRTRPGTRRSIHPTHSVCGVGPLVDTLLGDHHLDNTPCGPHSPFHRLRHYGGQILMLGCGLKPNTSMHAVEELVEPPYLFGPPLSYQLTLADGSMQHKIYRTHGFAEWQQRYDRVADVLDQNDFKYGTVLAAGVFLLDATRFWDAVLNTLQKDPLHFVDKIEKRR